MLLLLPPSEGKNGDAAGPPLNLATLSFPQLTAARQQAIAALIRLSRGRERRALAVLGLSPRQTDELTRNQHILDAPTDPAAQVYTGVLFAALGLPELTGPTLARANERIVITSSLFGLVKPQDPICAYRLAGSVSVPGLGKTGKVSTYWRNKLAKQPPKALSEELLVDFRSSTYVSFWPIPKGREQRALTVKIWQQSANGARTAVSHHNKAAKGELARLLATVEQQPSSIDEVVDCARSAGWDAALEPDPRLGHCRLDVVIR